MPAEHKLTTELFGSAGFGEEVKAKIQLINKGNIELEFSNFILLNAPLVIKSYTQYIETLDEVFSQTSTYAAQIYQFNLVIPITTKKVPLQFEKIFAEKLVAFQLPKDAFVQIVSKYDIYKIIPVDLVRQVNYNLYQYQLSALILEHILLGKKQFVIYKKTGEEQGQSTNAEDTMKLPGG